MKNFIVLFSILFLNISVHAENYEMFTKLQRLEVLKAIDNYCGDTWCEGQYNFDFSDFRCNKFSHTCNLEFYFILSDETHSNTYSAVQNCHFTNITQFEQIKASNNSLNERFLEELSDCITTHEYDVKF